MSRKGKKFLKLLEILPLHNIMVLTNILLRALLFNFSLSDELIKTLKIKNPPPLKDDVFQTNILFKIIVSV